MRALSRALIVPAVVALTGGAGLAATSTPADATSVGVRVGVNTGYYSSPYSYYHYRPYYRYHYRPYRYHYYHYRPYHRYYYRERYKKRYWRGDDD